MQSIGEMARDRGRVSQYDVQGLVTGQRKRAYTLEKRYLLIVV
jgi:hypothetical protein